MWCSAKSRMASASDRRLLKRARATASFLPCEDDSTSMRNRNRSLDDSLNEAGGTGFGSAERTLDIEGFHRQFRNHSWHHRFLRNDRQTEFVSEDERCGSCAEGDYCWSVSEMQIGNYQHNE